MNLSPKSQTTRLIERIDTVEKFRDIAELCEDFRSFVDEISEWGVDHIGGVDFYGVGFEPVSYTHLTLPTILLV